MFRTQLSCDPARVTPVIALNEREAIRDVPLLTKSLSVLALVIAGFILHSLVNLEPAIVALLGAGLLVLITRHAPRKNFADVSVQPPLFFVGLFNMMGGPVGP